MENTPNKSRNIVKMSFRERVVTFFSPEKGMSMYQERKKHALASG